MPHTSERADNKGKQPRMRHISSGRVDGDGLAIHAACACELQSYQGLSLPKAGT